MRRLVLALVAVLLCGCGQAAATPTVAPLPSPTDILQAFRDAGLKAEASNDALVYAGIQKPGLIRYQTIITSRVGGSTIIVAEYDTATSAEQARGAVTNRVTSGYRRDRLVLAIPDQLNADPYFTVFMVTGR